MDTLPASARKGGTLALVCLATAMLMLDIAVVNTALPHIASDLNARLAGVQWVVDAYTLALATVVLSAGSLADRFGRRRLFSLGFAVFTASSLACAVAGDIAVLDGARAVQGIGAAMLFATSLAILADAFRDGAERAKAFAAYGATIGGSFALGPAVGGALTSGISWRAVFYLNIPLGIAALALTPRLVRESRALSTRRLDVPGQLLLASGLFTLVLALLRARADGWGSDRIVGGLALAAVLLVAFAAVERSRRQPMLPLGLFARPAFTGAQVAAFAISASFFALFFYITLYLQEVLHLSPFEAGLVYVPGTVVIAIVSAATGMAAGRISARAAITGGLLLVAAGLALMTLADAGSSWTALLPGEIVACIGTGLVNPMLANVALSSVSPDQSGLAAGVNDAFRQAGVTLGVAAFGTVIPAAAALGQGDPASYVDGLHHALVAGAALVAVGALACAALLGPARQRARSEATVAETA
jgi:EmrB/QacA subfamily drug resistance transporter